jgi:indole-3-glycerol phosphate synthase
MIPDDFIKHRRAQIKKDREKIKEFKPLAKDTSPPLDLINSIKHPLSIILEFRKKTFSQEQIPIPQNIPEFLSACKKTGVKAISIFTTPELYGYDIEDTKTFSDFPLIQKDIILDEYQIWQARCYRISSVLLLPDLYSNQQFEDFLGLCRDLSIVPFIEVSNQTQFDNAMGMNLSLIGIQNIDFLQTVRLLEQCPAQMIKIVEYGLTMSQQIQTIRELKAEAILLCEEVFCSGDPLPFLKQIASEFPTKSIE